MISQNNYELVKPFLDFQIKERGWDINFSRKDWDTFHGWKKRGKSIKTNSVRGVRLEDIKKRSKVIIPKVSNWIGIKENKTLNSAITRTYYF